MVMRQMMLLWLLLRGARDNAIVRAVNTVRVDVRCVERVVRSPGHLTRWPWIDRFVDRLVRGRTLGTHATISSVQRLLVKVVMVVRHVVGINLASGTQIAVRTLGLGLTNGTGAHHVVRWLRLSSQMMVMVVMANRWIGRTP
uniref:Putative secreted protein n=1 Tax=Anopheles triannulatus TaxID=58253 RepID=A0A2M4B6F3_9DIPT